MVRRLKLVEAELSELRFLGFCCKASSLDEVMAARGGLDGGDGSPEIGTSGIPLGPCCKNGESAYHMAFACLSKTQ